jgi:hypothetical protein
VLEGRQHRHLRDVPRPHHCVANSPIRFLGHRDPPRKRVGWEGAPARARAGVRRIAQGTRVRTA